MTPEELELERRKLSLEEEKERNAFELRQREIAIEERKGTQPSGSRTADIGIGGLSLISAMMAGLASLGTAYLTGSFSVRQSENASVGEQSLERQKFSYELIKTALSEADERARARRLLFMVNIGLLDDLNADFIRTRAELEVERLKQGGQGESLLPNLTELDRTVSMELFRNVNELTAYLISDKAIRLMDEGGILDNVNRSAAFLAMIDYNTENATRLMEENAGYSAARLQSVFPRIYPDLATAEQDARNPEAILNRVYAGRGGNTEPDDGWRFRMRGFVGLSGRANYVDAAEALSIDLLANPDLASDPETALRIAIYWFSKLPFRGKTLVEWADAENFEEISRALIGIPRGPVAQPLRHSYDRILRALGSEEFTKHPIVVALHNG